MRRLIPNIPSFVFAMVMMTIFSGIIWQVFVTDKLYNCTDDGIPGYVTPRSWVHGKIAFVREVTTNRSMSEPDTIKEGWSRGGLWALWSTFFAVSVAVSAVFSRKLPLS